MHKLIGIIAEDKSDVNSIKILIERIINRPIGVKCFVGHGCGAMVRKSSVWVKLLYSQACTSLIVIHDSDGNPVQPIYDSIKSSIDVRLFNSTKYIICIPVQELEAWLLSDPVGIKKAMELKKTPKVNGEPETINSPKEYLGKIILNASDKNRVYINTIHNEIIANQVSLSIVEKKCLTFRPFVAFVKKNIS